MKKTLPSLAVLAITALALTGCAQSPAHKVNDSAQTSASTTSASPTLPGDPSDYGLDDSGDGATDTATDDTSTDTSTDDTSTDDSSDAQTLKVGDTADLGDWHVTVTKVSKPTHSQVHSWNMFNDSPKGTGVLVEYTAKYVGDERKDDASFALSWSFAGSDGTDYDEDYNVVTPKDQADAPTTARKGGTIKGDLFFDLPAKAFKGGMVSVETMDTYADFTL